MSLCFGAIVNTWPHFHMGVPYLGIAVPAVVGALAGFYMRQRDWSRKLRLSLIVAVGFVVTLFGAGVLSELSVPGSFAAVAFHPWTVTGRIPSATSALSWFLVSLSVSRGLGIGSMRASFAQTIRSVVCAAIAFLTLFVVMAKNHSPGLRAATHLAEPLFVLYFLAALALLRLSRARDIEGTGTAIAAGGAPGAWVALLASPLLVVAVVAFAVAAALGTFGGAIGHAARDVAHAIGFAVTEVARGFAFVIEKIFEGIAIAVGAIVGLFVHHHAGKSSATTHVTTTTLAHQTNAYHTPIAVTIVVVGLFVAFLAFGLGYLSRHFSHGPPKVAKVEGDETSSVFSWRHLFSQFAGLLGRALRRLLRLVWHPRAETPAVVAPAAPELDAVRREYRRLLLSARRGGLGRAPTETAAEFTARVLAELGSAAEALPALTAAYEIARYSERAGHDAQALPAAELEAVVALFEMMAVAEEAARAEAAEAEPART